MPTQGSCWCLRAAKHRALGELDSLFRLALSLTTCVWKSAEFGGHPPALDPVHLLGKKAPAIDFSFPLCDFLPIYSCYSKMPTAANLTSFSCRRGCFLNHWQVFGPTARWIQGHGSMSCKGTFEVSICFNLEYPGFHTKTCRIWMISIFTIANPHGLKFMTVPKKYPIIPPLDFPGLYTTKIWIWIKWYVDMFINPKNGLFWKTKLQQKCWGWPIPAGIEKTAPSVLRLGLKGKHWGIGCIKWWFSMGKLRL